MSQFRKSMGELDEDSFNALNMQMPAVNSLMPDPPNMLAHFDSGFQQNALMERDNQTGGLFGSAAVPYFNPLLSADNGSPNGGASFRSNSITILSSGEFYHATTSSMTGPDGICETRKTVEDSHRGLKKMAIGHHIGDRSHIIEKEQDLRSGQMEERHEFINLVEAEAEQFDREFANRARMNRPRKILSFMTHYFKCDSGGQHRRQMPALPGTPSTENKSVHPHPYNPSAARRDFRAKHTKQHQQPHQSQITITEISDDDEPTVISDDDESTPTVATTEDSESER